MNQTHLSKQANSPRPIARRDPVRRALLLVLLLTLFTGSTLFVLGAWAELRMAGMDLQQDYLAAQRMQKDGDLYTRLSAAEIAAIGVQEQLGFGMRQNVHPPFAILLFVPLTHLSFALTSLLWTLGSALLLCITTLVLVHELALPITGIWRAIVPLLLLNWYPVWLHFHLGQLTILLFALIIAAWCCLHRNRDGLAGALLGLAALIKIFPIFLLGYALFRLRWRVLGAACATMLVLVLAQTVGQPRAYWLDYVTEAAPNNATEWVRSPRNASLNNLSTRLFTGSSEVAPLVERPGAELPTRVMLYAVALGCMALVLWRRRHTPDLTGEYSLFIAAMVLLSPISWEHAFIFLLLPFGYLWQRVRRQPGHWRRAPLLFGSVALLLSMYPAEIVLLKIKALYLPNRMPALVGLLAPGIIVVICCYIAMLLLLRHPLDVQHNND